MRHVDPKTNLQRPIFCCSPAVGRNVVKTLGYKSRNVSKLGHARFLDLACVC